MKPIFGQSDACADAEMLIQQSLDAPLRPAERHRLDRHLATCESCRQAWDEYRRLSRAAGQWVNAAAVDPGDDFTKRVMTELGITPESPVTADGEPGSTPRRGRGVKTSRLAWGVGVAVIMAAVACGFVPQAAHVQSALMEYANGLHAASSMPSWRADSLAFYAVDRPDFADVLTPMRSWTWPVYAFAAALAANVALAGVTLRHRRRAA
jgi:hypothetical protein